MGGNNKIIIVSNLDKILDELDNNNDIIIKKTKNGLKIQALTNKTIK